MNEVQLNYVTKAIQESIQNRVDRTIKDYATKNAQAFAENQIAGVEWNLQLTVLVDNLGLIPQPKPSGWKRFKDFFIKLIN